MRVRQIGTLVFDENTNIVVDANTQDAAGIGFNINKLFDPVPFSVEIAFKRATRQQALNAINALARELYTYAQRRQNNYLAVAGGVQVIIEDATGNATLRSYLRDSNVSLLSVETTAAGVIARARVDGVLNGQFVNPSGLFTSITSLKAYERRIVALNNASEEYLYKTSFEHGFVNANGLYNSLLAIEVLENATATSRILAVNPASVSSGIILETWNAGWMWLQRANFNPATSGTLTFNILNEFPKDIYRLFIEIYCPSSPSQNAYFTISWPGQPQISERISGNRSWYMPTLVTTAVSSYQITIEVYNVPRYTRIMPLVLIPTDGVFVWNYVSSPTLQTYSAIDTQTAVSPPFYTNPPGIVYGSPGFVSGRHIAVFNGMMVPAVNVCFANINFYSFPTEPAAYA